MKTNEERTPNDDVVMTMESNEAAAAAAAAAAVSTKAQVPGDAKTRLDGTNEEQEEHAVMAQDDDEEIAKPDAAGDKCTTLLDDEDSVISSASSYTYNDGDTEEENVVNGDTTPQPPVWTTRLKDPPISQDGLGDAPTTRLKNPPPSPDELEDDKELMAGDEEDKVEVVDSAVETAVNETHRKHDEALEKSCSVLQDIQKMLDENPLFCSEDRRQEMSTEIDELLAKKDPPQAVIGCLGNTGVGKSSLLNALLDEASILPTSGSRGCTAAVVELRYNTDLQQQGFQGERAVYKGTVEFMTLAEWHAELKILVEECATHEEKRIYANTPDSQNQPDAAVAWSKINQVYGHGTMERYQGYDQARVYKILETNNRVRNLLTSPTGNPAARNNVSVEEGKVQHDQAAVLLQDGMETTDRRLRNSSKKWAKSFRAKINDYVYRKGSGREPQTWPLIRKVVLQGPWKVLSTGACLVDLPGVRDANAARANVAKEYLQNCSQIWIAAPIKRAVDDGTAKELLGENFKRRLLMDGQYGNVSFICTQTDDVVPTETMQDHQDVAEKLGCWDKLLELRDRLLVLEQQLNDLEQEEESLKAVYQDAKDEADAVEQDLKEAAKDGAADNDEDDDIFIDDSDRLEKQQADLLEKRKLAAEAKQELKAWRKDHAEEIQQVTAKTRKLQQRLKAICAIVRNEYSKTCLQEDFRAGLEELTRNDGEENGNGQQGDAQFAPIPDDFQMDVFCCSANDFLKIKGIKPSSDGPPNAFSQAADTQIPALREFVHNTTAKQRTTYSHSFVEATSNILDQMKLFASDAKVPSGRTARRSNAAFGEHSRELNGKVKLIVEDFSIKAGKWLRSVAG